MKSQTFPIRTLVSLVAASCCLTAVCAEAALDQQQLTYNGGLSARTLPGYSVWQSFTAGVSGTLTEIDMGFFNNMSGSAQLQIFSGQGTQGSLLQTLTVPVTGLTQTAVTWNAWMVNVQVQAGQQYTFCLTPNATTLPDPYGVAVGSPNPYAGGVLGVKDPSGSYPTSSDAVFRTYVGAPSSGHLANISTRAIVNENPLIGGFIIVGGPKLVLIRAIGPSLAQFGVNPVLSDPVVRLYGSGSAQPIAENDDWQTNSNVAAIVATTLPPTNAKEAAILIQLQPGAYTAVISGAGGGNGNALVEVYDLGTN